MILLDGRTPSNELLSSFKSKARLDIILIGDNPSSIKYTTLKKQKAKELGVDCQIHHLPSGTTSSEIAKLITKLNADLSVTGFFIQLPIADKKLLSLISVAKDVDGLNPDSKFTPAVVLGIIRLLDYYRLSFASKKVVIINDSDLVGKPLLRFFPQAILCNDQTQNLSAITRTADLLISATGVKNIITADMVKKGAVVVDVASGDVDFKNVSPKCLAITPTYGGIGPMTIAMLFLNLATITENAHSTF